jgi:pyruvate/2-oxoglutarate dehydrogenase complex dihydrolipoamide dehydrogenase (E3) component
MGEDCLNTGCIPSKALIRSTRLLAQLSRSAKFGIKNIKAEFNFVDIMERVQRIVNTVAAHDSIECYNQLGVDILIGKARIISPWEVEV